MSPVRATALGALAALIAMPFALAASQAADKVKDLWQERQQWYAGLALQSPRLLSINTDKGAFSIDLDTGKVTIPKGLSLDDASRRFYEALGQQFVLGCPAPQPSHGEGR